MPSSKLKIGIIYFFLVLSYFFSYFFRVSTSVVLPIIQLDWGLSAGVIGFISSMYYYTYALMQPLCGVLNDRVGPTRIVGCGIIITSIGSFVFGLGTTTTSLIIGRLLMGIGLSPMLSGLLVFQGIYFKPEKYAFFSGLSMMIGNMGSVFSVGPLSSAMKLWGRQAIFSCLSCVTILITIALFCLSLTMHRKETSGSFFAMLSERFHLAVRVVRQSSELKKIIFIWMISFGALMAFQGLWAVSWFQVSYAEYAGYASIAATCIGIGVMAGNLLGGYICKRPETRNRYVTICVYLIVSAWVILVACFAFHAPFLLTIAITTLLGIANGMGFTQFTAAINDIAPTGQGGAVFGIANFFIFTCVIIFQWGTGAMLDIFQQHISAPASFLYTFLIVLAFLIAIVFVAAKLRPFRKNAIISCEASA